MTRAEIGELLGVTEQRVGQIERQAIKKMRDAMTPAQREFFAAVLSP